MSVASPVVGVLLSPVSTVDLGNIGAGQHHRDQLHDGQKGSEEGVDHQHRLDLCSHLVAKDLHTAVFPNAEIVARDSVILQLVPSASLVNNVTTTTKKDQISFVSLLTSLTTNYKIIVRIIDLTCQERP